jgi:hypothetical protein
MQQAHHEKRLQEDDEYRERWVERRIWEEMNAEGEFYPFSAAAIGEALSNCVPGDLELLARLLRKNNTPTVVVDATLRRVIATYWQAQARAAVEREIAHLW